MLKIKIIGCISITLLHMSVTYTQVVSFDELFPPKPFKKTVDTCMQVWSEIRLFDTLTKQEPSYQEVHDLIVGRLVRLNGYIDQIITELNEGAVCTRSDIDYLLSIIDTITYERARVEMRAKSSVTHAIQNLLRCAREKMRALL